VNHEGKQGFHFTAGGGGEKTLHFTLYFWRWLWRHLLRRVEFYLSLYQSEPPPLGATSLVNENQMKRVHDSLLRRILGQPHIVHTAGGAPYPPDFPIEVIYNYPWGTVTSSHNRKNIANTQITIQYKVL